MQLIVGQVYNFYEGPHDHPITQAGRYLGPSRYMRFHLFETLIEPKRTLEIHDHAILPDETLRQKN